MNDPHLHSLLPGLLPRPDVAAQAPVAQWPVLRSVDLLRGGACVHIEHDGALYVLRATRSGKLILTK